MIILKLKITPDTHAQDERGQPCCLMSDTPLVAELLARFHRLA